MAAPVPQPLAIEEARRFVGTQVERRFNTRRYRGWCTATVEEVNLGYDLGLAGEDAGRLWCLLRYQPEDAEEEGDSEDQSWHFVFNSPGECRRQRLPSAAREWLQSPAAAAAAAAAAAEAHAAAAADAAAAGVQAAELGAAEAFVAAQQAGGAVEGQPAAEQQGALTEPPLPPLPAEQVRTAKRRRRATTTVPGQQQAAAEAPAAAAALRCVGSATTSGLSADGFAAQEGACAALQSMAAAPTAAATAAGPAGEGGRQATAALPAMAAEGPHSICDASVQPQLTEADVAAALRQAAALQGSEPSGLWAAAQEGPAVPAAAAAPAATAAPAPPLPASELATPQANAAAPAAQQVEKEEQQMQTAQQQAEQQEEAEQQAQQGRQTQQDQQAQQQQEAEQQVCKGQRAPQAPTPHEQSPTPSQLSARQQGLPQVAQGGWGGLMDRLARVAQHCVEEGLMDQVTAWRYRLKANRPGGFTEEQLAVEVRVMEDIEAAGQLEAAAEAIHAFVARS